MATLIIAVLILGAAGYIVYKKVMKMKSGDFTCEGCKGGRAGCSSCSSCPAHRELEQEKKEEKKDSIL